MEILFIGKENDTYASKAGAYLKLIFPDAKIVYGSRGAAFPGELLSWKGDYLFSYLSPWIIPGTLLENAKMGAINWHPGPPEYPGIGCTNFAIYNNEKEFGITCHYMLSKVDTGKVIETARFAILEEDGVFSITQKCYVLILQSFLNIINKISRKEALPESTEHWTRKPYTRKELDALSRITPDMSRSEIEKRVKATTYDKPWAFVEIQGLKFFYKD
jgi:methionyl-tRNA formyltransferase